ncbi:MAG: hypothetical protein LUQ11_00090 [Methylococcaceae bacterium]|nr:hypothetical protein [Methylococcaceae bacterium]
MNHLAKRVDANNPHQFAKWYDGQQTAENRATTVGSGKWAKNFKGQVSLKNEQLELLSGLFPDAWQYYQNGPADLWKALWADPRELWALCRTRYCDDGPEYDDRIWEMFEDERLLRNERSLEKAMAEFEGELLLAEQYGESFTLRHLTEAIALCRLHRFINDVVKTEADGSGIYRCIRICLNDLNVWGELFRLGVVHRVYNVLANMESQYLSTDESYRLMVGVELHQIDSYIDNPLEWISSKYRWKALAQKLDWVT